jgi:hypothetical protein
MKQKYKLIIVAVLAVVMLRVCLSNEKKKEDAVLNSSSEVVPVTLTPNAVTSGIPVNPAVFGINIGFAFKRELDKDSGFVQLLRDLRPHSLRFPGGTVANYYHPKLPVYGYKREEIPFGLGTLYMEQTRRKENILYNFIRLAKSVNAGVVYCANVYTGSTKEILFVISQLKKNNIPIIGVELGNEFSLSEYRKKFPEAKIYIDKIKATAKAIRIRHPELKIAVIGGDGVPMNDNSARGKFMRGWNQDLSKEQFFDTYTWHPYADCPPCDKEAYFDKVYLKNMEALAPQRTKYLFNLGKNMMQVYGQQRKLWLTEWNLGNLNYLDNTFLQGAYVMENFLTMIELNTRFNNYFEVSNLHSIDGLISVQKGKLQPVRSNGADNATVQYFAFKYLAGSLSGPDVYRSAETISVKDSIVRNGFVCQTYFDKKQNKTLIFFINRSGKKLALTCAVPENAVLHVEAVEADYPYATAGKTYYEKDYPNKLKPVRIRDEKLKSGTLELSPYAFGVITVSN